MTCRVTTDALIFGPLARKRASAMRKVLKELKELTSGTQPKQPHSKDKGGYSY